MRKKIHLSEKGVLRGERIPYLVTATGTIDPYALAYSVARRHRLTPSSRETALDSIIAIRLWAKLHGINVEREMFYGYCLTTSEIESLKYYLRIKTKELRTFVVEKPSAINKRLLVAKRCCQATLNLKLQYAYDYLSFLGDWGNKFHFKSGSPDSMMCHRRLRLAKSVKKSKQSKVTHIPGSISEEMLSEIGGGYPSRLDQVSSADLNKFKLWLARVDLSEVWRNDAISSRNRVLLDLLAKCGGRLGEVLQVKSGDIDVENRGVRLVRRHNDPDDPRINEPNSKTYDRLVRFDARSWGDLLRWLDIHFDLTERSDTQFLFVNFSRDPRYAGRPMSHRAAREQVYTACAHAGLPRLRAHDLRHGSVRDLAGQAAAEGWSQEEWRKVSTYLFGWSDQSEMPTHYLGDQWVEQAAKIMEEIWMRRGAPDANWAHA